MSNETHQNIRKKLWTEVYMAYLNNQHLLLEKSPTDAANGALEAFDEAFQTEERKGSFKKIMDDAFKPRREDIHEPGRFTGSDSPF